MKKCGLENKGGSQPISRYPAGCYRVQGTLISWPQRNVLARWTHEKKIYCHFFTAGTEWLVLPDPGDKAKGYRENIPFIYVQKISLASFRCDSYEGARVHGHSFDNFLEMYLNSLLS